MDAGPRKALGRTRRDEPEGLKDEPHPRFQGRGFELRSNCAQSWLDADKYLARRYIPADNSAGDRGAIGAFTADVRITGGV